jgi:hypothetical protein
MVTGEKRDDGEKGGPEKGESWGKNVTKRIGKEGKELTRLRNGLFLYRREEKKGRTSEVDAAVSWYGVRMNEVKAPEFGLA